MNVRKLAMTIASAGALGAIPAQASNLEEIIVTAQKREQSLIEVPLAVGAISGATLQAKGVESVAELEFSLPSLVIAENSGGGLVATALVTRG
jgi:outer membrane receptor protein involved in Fe transport